MFKRLLESFNGYLKKVIDALRRFLIWKNMLGGFASFFTCFSVFMLR